MSAKRIFWIVLGAVFVIGALCSGGYALYRLGYARGAQTSAFEMIPGEMHFEFMDRFDEFGDHLPPGFEGRFHEGFGGRFTYGRDRGRLPLSGFYSTTTPFSFIWVIPGLLFIAGFAGLVAFAVVGVKALIRSNREPEDNPTKDTKK